MKCKFIPKVIYKEWTLTYQMEPYMLIAFATSMAPNGVDIWLSGGISAKLIANNILKYSIVDRLNVIKNRSLTIEDGPDLPRPLAGHCQVLLCYGRVFIYGGVSSIYVDRTMQTFNYSNQAYLWVNDSWSSIPVKNPCSNKGQDLAFQQPCAEQIISNQTLVVIVTFIKRVSCTSILNLNTYEWTKVNNVDVLIPIGGHLVMSIDKTSVFYMGGLYYKPEESQSLDIFELGSNGWRLIEAKLPFGISSNETKSYPSTHNITMH